MRTHYLTTLTAQYINVTAHSHIPATNYPVSYLSPPTTVRAHFQLVMRMRIIHGGVRAFLVLAWHTILKSSPHFTKVFHKKFLKTDKHHNTIILYNMNPESYIVLLVRFPHHKILVSPSPRKSGNIISCLMPQPPQKIEHYHF